MTQLGLTDLVVLVLESVGFVAAFRNAKLDAEGTVALCILLAYFWRAHLP